MRWWRCWPSRRPRSSAPRWRCGTRWRMGDRGHAGLRPRGAPSVGGAKRNPRATWRMIAGMARVSGGARTRCPSSAWAKRAAPKTWIGASLHPSDACSCTYSAWVEARRSVGFNPRTHAAPPKTWVKTHATLATRARGQPPICQRTPIKAHTALGRLWRRWQSRRRWP